ncbi:MAG TPA: S9 family peptidase [Thermomicrobiaceae bacterium]|nr:S9 family peptidase [Thermomicrobiaceae bacterium]
MVEAERDERGDDLRLVQDVQLDPSGQRLAYVVASPGLEHGEPTARSQIWIAPDEGEPYAATQGEWADVQPRWSPDGATLAFRSDRAKRGEMQLYLLRPGWREPELPHQFPAGVCDFAWSPDGATIAVVATDARPERAEGSDHVLYEDEPRYDRLWLLDASSGDARLLTEEPLNIWEFAWAPDGRALAAIASARPQRWSWYGARLVRIDTADGRITTLHTPESQLARPAWSPDGRGVAVVASTWSDPGMTGGDLLLVPVDGGQARNLTPGAARSYLSLHWQPDSQSLLASALERGQAAICEVGVHGGSETLWRGEHAFASHAISVDREGRRVAAALSGLTEPPEAWAGELDGGISWRQVSGHNAVLAGQFTAEVEEVSWAASDGRESRGLLLRPQGRAGERLPLVTMIHGGPTAASGYSYPAGGVAGWIPGLLERGAAIFLPNPRGSTGWGLEYAEANHRDMGGGDLDDILAGIDSLAQRGQADPERLGVCGWSYGGYLTAWAITQTTRFRAAIAGACISNWFSFHGTSDIPAFDEVFYRADPYALDGPYAARSPVFFADRVGTPTLFLHGERDTCCNVGQPMEMFRALRDRGVETQCVIYPREGHPVRERAHRQDMLERGLAWFTRHLGL